MQQQVLIATGGGLASALFSLGLLTGGTGLALLAYFSPLPLLLVGLTSGFRNAVIAGVSALVVLFVLGGFAVGGVYALTIMAPSWVVAYHALSQRYATNGAADYYAPGEIVARLVALGAAFVVVMTLAHMGNEGGVEESVRKFLAVSIAPLVPSAEADAVQQFLDRLVPLFPSFATLSWLVMLVVNATLAQGLLVKWGRALRPSPRYAEIEAPEWASWAIVAAAALKLMSTGDIEYLSQNLVLILSTPFFFVGLAVAYSLTRRTKVPGASMAVFYIFLMIFTWFAVLVAAVGFVEQWTKLRERYGQAPGALTSRHQPEDE